MLLEPMQDLVEKKFNINKEVVKTQIGTVKSLFRTHITDIQNKIASILRDRYQPLDSFVEKQLTFFFLLGSSSTVQIYHSLSGLNQLRRLMFQPSLQRRF